LGLLAHVAAPRCRWLVITYYVVVFVGNVVMSSSGFVTGRQSQHASLYIRVNV